MTVSMQEEIGRGTPVERMDERRRRVLKWQKEYSWDSTATVTRNQNVVLSSHVESRRENCCVEKPTWSTVVS